MTIENTERKHSGFGIASFITSIGIDIFIIALWYIIVSDITYAYGLPPSKTLKTTWSLCNLSKFGLLLPLGLGIGGLLQKGRKKLFAILGTIFSAMTILCILWAMGFS